MTDLSRALLREHLSPAHAEALDLGELAGAIAQARATWPEVQVDLAAVLAHLGPHLPTDVPPGAALRGLRCADLYIACACLGGDGRAVAALTERCFRAVAGRLVREGLAPAVVADAQQRLAALLFVGVGDQPPRLAQYTGRGDLQGWLYMAALRESRRLTTRENRRVDAGELDVLGDAADAADGVELHYFKQRYRGEFKAAFQAALAGLEQRERNLLRYQVIEGLGIDEIGVIYQVHRATAARWLVRVRERLFERTHALLMQRLRVGAAETESIIRMIRSQLDMSLAHALARDEPPGAAEN